MEDKKDKVWEALLQYKIKDPQPGYKARFYNKLSESPAKPSIVFFPNKWAISSVALSVVVLIGVFTFNITPSSPYSSKDKEIINNLDLAAHWQGIEQLDVMDDLEIIQQTELNQDI